MRIEEYGLKLIKLNRGHHYLKDDVYSMPSERVTPYRLVRGLGLARNQVGVLIYHGAHLCEFWYKNSSKKLLCVATSEYAWNKHNLAINNDTIVFDICKCARDNGITNVDIVQR